MDGIVADDVDGDDDVDIVMDGDVIDGITITTHLLMDPIQSGTLSRA